MQLGFKVIKEKVLVSSRQISRDFVKEYFNVIRDIDNLLRSEPLKIEGLKYFIPSKFVHNGNEYKEYLLTRDRFSLLIMRFNGARALEWKLKYIRAFNQMESFLREKQSAEWQQSRLSGKQIRHDETDVILEKLIPLAESQGSKNAGKLYINLF